MRDEEIATERVRGREGDIDKGRVVDRLREGGRDGGTERYLGT